MEWSRRRPSKQEMAAASADFIDDSQVRKAQAILMSIEKKLDGITDGSDNHAKTMRGQVDGFIQMATSAEKLRTMYIGCQPHL